MTQWPKIEGFFREIGKMIDWRHHIGVRLFIGILLVLLLALLYPGGSSRFYLDFQYKLGSIWTERDLTAPFSFPVYKDEHQYQTELHAASQEVLPVFERNERIAREQRDSLKLFFNLLTALLKEERTNPQQADAGNSPGLISLMNEIELRLTPRDWDILKSLHPPGVSLEMLHSTLAKTLDEVYTAGVIDQRKERMTATTIALRKNTEEQLLLQTKVLDVDEAAARVQRELTALLRSDNDTLMVGYKIGLCFLQPNMLFNQEQTEKTVKVAYDRVPRTIGIIQEGETIITRGQQVTEEVKLKLDSFKRFSLERGGAEQSLTQYFGKVMHSAIILVLFVLYLSLFRTHIINDSAMILLIAIVIFIEGVMAWLSLQINVGVPLEYLIFLPAASMVLTIAFDSRVGFYGTVAIGMIIGGIRGNDYALVLASIVAGGLSVYTVRNITHRTQIFRSIGYIFLGYIITIIALAFERADTLSTILSESTMAAANAVFSPVMTFGLLFIFERVFKITTDLRLLDLADDSHPLLQELAEKAPGTYHHSMAMGILAETAAEAIGAHALLARVGAYYHDIGKMEMPEYFVENQESRKSKHDRLKPRMSALIVTSHVKEGIEFARKHGLPEQVIDIIPQHHGTTLISYFYHKAQRRRNSKEEVNENDYRYPGPKPQTKEAGIVMLADGIEASVRALDEPTPPRIEDQIDSIIKVRFNDGQLDECDLTFNDLTKIKEAFLRALIGIHHARIKYPSAEDTLPSEPEAQQEETVQEPPLSPEEVAGDTGDIQIPEEEDQPRQEDSSAPDERLDRTI
jgi:putative nucleotidyltransferase with HDIG domain